MVLCGPCQDSFQSVTVGMKDSKAVIDQGLLTGHCLFLKTRGSLGSGHTTPLSCLLCLQSLLLSLLFWILFLYPILGLLRTESQYIL